MNFADQQSILNKGLSFQKENVEIFKAPRRLKYAINLAYSREYSTVIGRN